MSISPDIDIAVARLKGAVQDLEQAASAIGPDDAVRAEELGRLRAEVAMLRTLSVTIGRRLDEAIERLRSALNE